MSIPIPIVEKFPYNELEATTNKETGKRYYTSPTGEKLASVTTILGHTMDKTFLVEWRKRIGDKAADQIVKEASAAGTLMHTSVERHILGLERERKSNVIHKLAYDMAENIINRGLVNVNEVWGIEVPLYFPGIYAGRTDLVGVYNGASAIMDHKNSKKIKKREWINDYFIQGCAYSMAHNEVYGTDIKQVIIFMSSRDLDYKTFVLEGNEFHTYCDKWVAKLEEYFNSQ